MTELLRRAFDDAAKLPEAEQNLLASWLLAELAAEDDFDRTIARTSDRLASRAGGLAENRDGLTKELAPEKL